MLPRVWASLPAQQTGRHAVWLRRGRYALRPRVRAAFCAPHPHPSVSPSEHIHACTLCLVSSLRSLACACRGSTDPTTYPTSGPICARARVLAQPHPSPVRMVTARDVRPGSPRPQATGGPFPQCVCVPFPQLSCPLGAAHIGACPRVTLTPAPCGSQLSPLFHRCGD